MPKPLAEAAAVEQTTGSAVQNQSNADPSQNQGEQQPGQAPEASESPLQTVEDYKAALAEARKEAARYRTQRNELRPLAQKAKEIEDANKSELEKAQERIAALESEKTQAVLSAARAAVSAKTGVPAEFIHGEDEQQMLEYAENLAKAMEQKRPKPHLPHVSAVGRESATPSDKEAFANSFFGRNS